MQNNLKSIIPILKNKVIYPVIAIYVIVIILVGFTVYSGITAYSVYQKEQTVAAEVDQFEATVALIQNNKDILLEKIDEHNTTLSQVIPDTESYFAVISTLERLALRTGVRIDSYSIDLGSTGDDTLSLRIEFKGTPESLNTFYTTYQYAGGRLLTVDDIDVSDVSSGNASVTINFFHKAGKYVPSGNTNQIKESDLQLLEDIASKI